MRVRRAALTGLGQNSFVQWYCSLFGEVADQNDDCQPSSVTPVYNLAPGGSTGYSSVTASGVIASNPAGSTQTQTAASSNPDQLASSLAQNQANAQACQTAGGTYDPNTGNCNCSFFQSMSASGQCQLSTIVLIAIGVGGVLVVALLARR